ncbi:TPA: hypothetical protein DDZ86_00505 [Candidatus Dependentiae bacterium]|nr:MAG: C-terminus family protein [candidate division TM6 bacterium GW2011_GWF2_43_87]HBL98109.1 hypothetical protein [Candidatus Dependentiae bacterium]
MPATNVYLLALLWLTSYPIALLAMKEYNNTTTLSFKTMLNTLSSIKVDNKENIKEESPQERLLSFAHKGNIDGIKSILSIHKELINAHDPAYNRSILPLLIDAGAKLNELEDLLQFCSKLDKKFQEKSLIADADFDGETPLHRAALKNRADLLDLLLKHTPINSPSKNGDTALHLACSYGSLKVVEKLLTKKDILIGTLNNHNRTPLHNACLSGELEITKILVSHQALLNSMDLEGSTPLHLACKTTHSNRLQIIAFLIKSGASLTFKDKLNRRPIDLIFPPTTTSRKLFLTLCALDKFFENAPFKKTWDLCEKEALPANIISSAKDFTLHICSPLEPKKLNKQTEQKFDELFGTNASHIRIHKSKGSSTTLKKPNEKKSIWTFAFK